ncbi:MAG: glycosyltransferase [Planctomycetes bacterium]|nr:glycosyltransferase [Planctomycetota bacterium]MCB9910864.1 glycosyltransferase [Planctomycetota bacterium]MCB9912204.1 glycosyltransferase [Planctomycetota bacterium]HPF12990.1 glycosyltransferase [Planctomycetota bacterium]HRV79797.1 glycosyltransferase [Planctomycetota bacterium]
MTSESQPQVPCSIVITTCVDSAGLRANLAQVLPQAKELGAEVCLIFNCSESEVPERSRSELQGLVDSLLFETKPGKSYALNTAIGHVRGQIVAFTDDDAIPCTGWLAAILEPFTSDPRVVGVGGPVFPEFCGDGPPTWYRRILARKPSSFMGPKHYMGNEQVDYVYPTEDKIDGVPLGANCAWRREALLQHPYPPELGPNRATGLRGGEDTYVAIRIMEAGGRVVYQPKARVAHPVEAGRISLDYVLEGHRVQAIEYIRIMQLLGRPLPNLTKLVKYQAHLQRHSKLKPLQGEDRAIRRRSKRIFVAQLIDELRRVSAEAESAAPTVLEASR